MSFNVPNTSMMNTWPTCWNCHGKGQVFFLFCDFHFESNFFSKKESNKTNKGTPSYWKPWVDAKIVLTRLGMIWDRVVWIFFSSSCIDVHHECIIWACWSPARRVYTGDGTLFTLSMTTATWVVGLIVAWFRNWPPFEPFAMLGGFLWATGNVTVGWFSVVSLI